MLSIVASWIGWRYIPDLVSRVLLGYFHRLYASVMGRPPPAENSPEYIKHRRYLYSFVVFCYMTYTFQKTAASIGPNYYELLGVLPTADESALKQGFRAFARKYHPDRAGPEAEPLFMEVRDAYEALKNPVTRFAYDRFGPRALTWTNCTTMQDFVSHGLYQSTAVYVVGICALLFWNKIAPRDLAFWNYIILLATFSYELLYIFSPSPTEPSRSSLSSLIFTDPVSPSNTGIFSFFWPSRVAYQHISFLKSLSVLLSSALYQVLPNLFPSTPDNLDTKQLNDFFTLVNTGMKNLDTETSRIIHTELHSCHGTSGDLPFPVDPCQTSGGLMAIIDEEIQNIVMENTLCSQGGPLQSMIQQIQRRWKRATQSTPPRPTELSSITPSSSLQINEGINRGRSRSCDI